MDTTTAKTPPATQYFEVVIQPSPAGFGEFDVVEGNGEAWDDVDDLLEAIREGLRDGQGVELVELDGELPEGLSDIRGRIHNEPARVFGWVDESGEPHYVGIQEVG